jgi:hypothetical protein
MINEKLKRRLAKDRPMTSITLRIAEDVVESLKAIAPQKGYAGYQTLLKSYISDGLRRDEALAMRSISAERLAESLKRHGIRKDVAEEILQEAAAEKKRAA